MGAAQVRQSSAAVCACSQVWCGRATMCALMCAKPRCLPLPRCGTRWGMQGMWAAGCVWGEVRSLAAAGLPQRKRASSGCCVQPCAFLGSHGFFRAQPLARGDPCQAHSFHHRLSPGPFERCCSALYSRVVVAPTIQLRACEACRDTATPLLLLILVPLVLQLLLLLLLCLLGIVLLPYLVRQSVCAAVFVH